MSSRYWNSCLLLLALPVLAQQPPAGLWYDRAHDGHGLDWQRAGIAHTFVMYSYDAAGEPEWLVASGSALAEGAATAADGLRRFHYQVGRSPPQQPLPGGGGLQLSWAAADVARACATPRPGARARVSLRWNIDGEAGEWCIEPVQPEAPAPAPVLTGLWYAGPGDDGWGYSVDHGAVLATAVYYYDASGRGRWALGVDPLPGAGREITLNAYRGYCRSCAPQPRSLESAGSVRLQLPTPTSASNRLSIDAAPLPGAAFRWQRSAVPTELLSSPLPAGAPCALGADADAALPDDIPPYEALPATQLTATQLPPIDAAQQAARARFLGNGLARAGLWREAYARCGGLRPLRLGAIHFYAHENNIRYFPAATLNAYVERMADLGFARIGVHVGPYPWLASNQADPEVQTAIAKYDAIFERAHARGLELRIMLPISNSATLPMRTFPDYVAAMRGLVGVVLARYNGERGTPIAEVGMHEPSSIGKLLLEPALTDPQQWGAYVDGICALAKGVDARVRCTASLLPGPPAGPAGPGEYAFREAALRSRADALGVNQIHEYGLHSSVIADTDAFIRWFREGLTAADGSVLPGRGDAVFVNAAWRPMFPSTRGRLLQSNAAQLGCNDYAALDGAYLDGLALYARAHALESVNLFYTETFFVQQACPSTPLLYSAVQGVQPGSSWPDYQQGNAITDHLYRASVRQWLEQGRSDWSAAGQALLGVRARHRGM